MLRNIKICFTAFALLIGAVSCLEKYPGQAIPEDQGMQTYNDAEQHVVGIYASLKSSALFSGYLTLLPDIQSDLVYAAEGNTNIYGNHWQWTVRSTNAEIVAVYGSLYSVIGNCNFFLDCIDRVKANETDDEKLDDLDLYTGEVYAIRALCYTELLKCFCKAYDPGTARDELGVVLRTKYFEKEPAVRASLYDSYRFVLEDLTRAEALLSDERADNEANAVFFTLATAQALHARVALYMQEWQEAIDYSTELIEEYDFALASAKKQVAANGVTEFDYMWFYDQSPEVIFRIGFTSTSYGGSLGTVFLNFQRDYYYFYPDYVPAQWVLDAYDDGDLRKAAYFADADNGIVIGYANGMQWPLLVKYYGNRTLIQNRIYHVSMPKLFRLAEQYLIRAEARCNLETPDFAAAGKDLTTLRATRYQTGGTMNLTQENWKQQISDERMRELYMEGFRLHDLKRWNMGFERTEQKFAQQEGSTLKIEAGDPRFVWPIPQHEIEAPGSQILPNESK
ncbi:MAG: RagB/SusD family nutrient uptake outer membrane protein [Alistipes sp.]|nr:RagB/SusD family nutrient uptake outer membrane protein [Alistipes senegalensis]MCM1249881.1 RagB/SusD family nutrient uptake outer membrane protein [Alistipes sp.]